MHCLCPFCTDSRRPMYLRTDEELWILVQMRDNWHKEWRVYAYIELIYRSGNFDPHIPYLVWTIVMGDIPPPMSRLGFGAFPIKHDAGWSQAWQAH